MASFAVAIVGQSAVDQSVVIFSMMNALSSVQLVWRMVPISTPKRALWFGTKAKLTKLNMNDNSIFKHDNVFKSNSLVFVK